ncbi:MAG: UDP-3-O-(3-hydroxymyristoyl)glucosamine N-acyltransferase [Rhizobacter sp.]|nr:UDP-3-O-(3-hydroxymyristoyl)glucosamine N-acyltransferase [Chlorobiales bacterium]
MTLLDIQNYLLQFLPSVEITGDETRIINRLAKIEDAVEGDLTFIANPKYEKFLETTAASAILISPKLATAYPSNRATFIKTADPYTAFVFLLEKLSPPRTWINAGSHPAAIIARTASVHPSASIGAGAYIGEQCVIGEGSFIGHNTVVMTGTRIGAACTIYPNVTIYDGSQLGDRVTIHSGSAVGSDGFGFAPQPDGSYRKIPQTGIVVIEDDVEIGANVCIDRATLGETRIEKGAKIDNLVQIAHNVRIGANTVVAAQTGISGSTSVGQSCMIGGQAGLVGHLTIADRVVIGAQSGVSRSIMAAGEIVRGWPAQPIKTQLRQEAIVRRLETDLAAMMNRIKALESELAQMKAAE